MTEKFFMVHGIKKEEAKAPWNKGKGLACLMHFPIPDWAVEEKQEGEIAESLWNHFKKASILYLLFRTTPGGSMPESRTGRRSPSEKHSKPKVKRKPICGRTTSAEIRGKMA